MKRLFLLFLLILVDNALVAQTVADTAIVLKHVDVQGIQFSSLNRGEIKLLNVENDLTSISATTSEALRHIPAVVTDIEGGILVRGSNRPGMLLNGVPYGLLEEYSGDMLIQLPSVFFRKVSLNTYSPVTWLPEGEGGVLNLASSVPSEDDTSLIVTLGGGLQERYNAGVIVGLHPGKFHIVAKYNYRHEYRDRKFNKTTTNDAGTTVLNNSASAHPEIHLADLSISYDLSSRDLLSTYGMFYQMDYYRYGGINNTRYGADGELINKMLRHRNNNQKQKAYAIEGRWLHLFDKPGSRFELVFNYNNFLYDETNDFANENPQGQIVAQDNLFVDQKKNNYYLSASYHAELNNDWLLSAGLLGRYREEDYNTIANDLKEGEWRPNLQKSNTFGFSRLTSLVYTSLEKKWDRLSAEVGLQAEYSSTKIDDSSDNYLRLYPRFRMSYYANESSGLIFSYQQHAIRPYGADLNSFLDRSDATYIKKGNPDLKDEIVHSFDVSHLLYYQRIHVSPAFYYRHKTNRIVDIYKSEGEGNSYWQKENTGSTNTFGGELSLVWTPSSRGMINLMGNVYRDEIDGRRIGYGEKKSMVSWDVKSILSWNITPTTKLQLDAFYVSDQLTPQGKIKSRASVNAGLSQYFMSRKLCANLSVNNIFNSLEEVLIIHTDNTHLHQVRNRDPRVSWLTLTYYL